MTNSERANKIAELSSKLVPIAEKKIILELTLNALKAKNNESDTPQINQLEKEYVLIYGLYTSLYFQIRSFQKKYLVQYIGELTNSQTNRPYERSFRDEFYLSTETIIDTFENGWGLYINNPDVIELLKEVSSYVHIHRCTLLSIKNIKSF